MSSTENKVGLSEHPDHRLDELQLRDRCIVQLRGPTKEQKDKGRGEKTQNTLATK